MNEASITPKRRPAAAMAGHALALAFAHSRQDHKDACAMRSFATLRNAVHRRAWMTILAFGLAGRHA